MTILHKSFFEALASSTVKDLRLFRVFLIEEFELSIPSNVGRRHWPLERLHMELFMEDRELKDGNASPLTTSILRLAAPTLKGMTWESSLNSRQNTAQTLLNNGVLDPPSFPSLLVLDMRRMDLADSSVLDSLLGPDTHVQALRIDTESSSMGKDFFTNRGHVPSLEAFGWTSANIAIDHDLAFLRANTQLSKLLLSNAINASLLEDSLLPLLSEEFTQLTSLSLAWATQEIGESSLRLIGTLIQLQQLHISAGSQWYWEGEDWDVDHSMLRPHLSNLQSLRKLHFTRDTYESVYGYQTIEDDDENEDRDDSYYMQTVSCKSEAERAIRREVPGASPEDQAGFAQDRPEDGLVFERIHRHRMTNEAQGYASQMPNLQQILIGQLIFAIRRDVDTRAVSAECLSDWYGPSFTGPSYIKEHGLEQYGLDIYGIGSED